MKKRILVVFIISLLILGAFMLGVKAGEKRVIDNQIITNENNEQGFYYSDYNGNEYSYYYE
jgi:peptidoglycan hydrolase CwlO-like protein